MNFMKVKECTDTYSLTQSSLEDAIMIVEENDNVMCEIVLNGVVVWNNY